MAKAYIPRHYRNAIIKGYVVEKAGKAGEYTYEKLIVTFVKADGTTTKDSKIAVTSGTQTCLKGLQPHLEKVLSAKMEDWESLVGKPMNIPVKLIMLNTKLNPEGFPEFVTHSDKPTILLADAPEPTWTDAEIEAMRPKGKAPNTAAPMAAEAPVVNTSDDAF